jgi:hypothetical protein
MMFYYTLGCGVVGLAGVWQHRVFFEIPVTALTAFKARQYCKHGFAYQYPFGPRLAVLLSMIGVFSAFGCGGL